MLTDLGKKKRQRILVVDQDGPTREFLANIIKLLGCEFELTASVEEALNALEKTTFDLLITDLHLPESQKLVENSVQKSPTMRAICMVRHRQVLLETYRLGGAIFIPKPFNFDDMINKIRQSIHEKNLHEVEAEFRRLRREVFRILT
jgi:DNA-binding NtrC family response regulator